jgi:hypothetical protein
VGLATVRVGSFSFVGGSGVVVLSVCNSKHRVFSALHPEPLLRIATVRGLTKWLVTTGCKFPSDLAAFQFALPTLLKLQHGGIPGFVRVLGEYAVDAASKLGARKLLEVLLGSPSTRPHDSRAALQGAQAFLSEVELASLWQQETQRSASSQDRPALTTSSTEAPSASLLELDDIMTFSPKQVASALSAVRQRQYIGLAPADIVGFAMISPDPLSFELYADVAEFVDFGNTLGRWGKECIVRASSRGARATRIRWIYQVLLELDALRNYDLCFHLSGSLLWELLPDLAKQSKVDIEKDIYPQVKKYGDRKFWNGQYAARLSEDQALIPLLVYHSNLISGGSGGADSVIEKGGRRFVNMSKFRSVSDQLAVLQRVHDKCTSQFSSSAAAPPSELLPLVEYFQRVQVLSDAEITRLRSEIIPLSKFRESAKVTSVEGFAADVTASLASVDRRLVRWRGLVRMLESENESVRLRTNCLVCPRDALVDGSGILPAFMRALLTKSTELRWLSPEYWLLRRLVRCATVKLQFEDVILCVCALYALAVDVLPDSAETLLGVACDFAAGKSGCGVLHVVRALLALQETAKATLPELTRQHDECEKSLVMLKKQDGALSRKEALMTIGNADGFENATVRIVKSKKSGVVDSAKLQKAKLEHFRFQKESIGGIQTQCREMAIMFDCWNATVSVASDAATVYPHNFQLNFHFFLVKYCGSKWGEGAATEFVHFEPVALTRAEFQEKLSVLYEPVFGKDVLKFGVEESECSVVFFPVRQLLQKHVFETEVDSVGQKTRVRYTCEQNLGMKRRWKVMSSAETVLTPVEALVEDLRSRTGVILDEVTNRKRCFMLLMQACSPTSSWYQLLVRAAQLNQTLEIQTAVCARKENVFVFFFRVTTICIKGMCIFRPFGTLLRL